MATMACLATLCLGGVNSYASEWESSATLYLWLPSVDGTMKYDFPESEDPLPVDSSAILDALEMTFMGAFETRNDKIMFLADVVYLDLGNTKTTTINFPKNKTLEGDVEQNLEGWQVALYGGYNIMQTNSINLDLIGGMRYLSIDTDITLSTQNREPLKLSRNSDFLDVVAGVRGKFNITKNWFIPFHADVGTGQSELTYQLISGVGYAANWGDVTLFYRHLGWSQSDEELFNDFILTGSGISYKYHF